MWTLYGSADITDGIPDITGISGQAVIGDVRRMQLRSGIPADGNDATMNGSTTKADGTADGENIRTKITNEDGGIEFFFAAGFEEHGRYILRAVFFHFKERRIIRFTLVSDVLSQRILLFLHIAHPF